MPANRLPDVFLSEMRMDDATLREALAIANIPTLIPVLVQLTGDERWLEERYRPTRNRGLGDNATGGLPEEAQQEIRDAAFSAIAAWRDGHPPARPTPSEAELLRMLSFTMGEDVAPEYGPMIAAELGLGPQPAPWPQTRAGFKVLVIGAGISGLALGVRLTRAQIDHEIIEREDEVGGTWYVNRYPGCGVDTPSALYSFAWEPWPWSKHFALRDELHAYLAGLADRHGLRERISFATEVVAADWDEGAQEWVVTLRPRGGGPTEVRRASVLISGTGVLSRPRWPDIPGLETFAGPLVHPAQWPDGLDLTGKRVGIIGNGATSMQVVPAIADEVASLTIFQRSPQWAAPFEYFHTEVPEPARRLSMECGPYRSWYRLRTAWTFNDRLHATLQKDPQWPHPERAVNAVNDGFREFFTRYMEEQLAGRPDLLAKALPTYPPYGKRILLDNGWFRTLTRDHVDLVTEPIERIDPGAVVTAGGDAHELDVLICATGFDALRFLAPIEIRGRDGVSLREYWGPDDASAYLGTTVPGFPNLFICYGPNTQGGHGGSIVGTNEAIADYIMDVLRQMLEQDLGAASIREEVYRAYTAEVDDRHERMIWTHPGMTTYYRNPAGRVVVPSPWRVVDFWAMTRHADLEEFETEPLAARAEGAA